MKLTDCTIDELTQRVAKSFVKELEKQAVEKGYHDVFELIIQEYGGVVETTLKIDFTKSKKEAREAGTKEKEKKNIGK